VFTAGSPLRAPALRHFARRLAVDRLELARRTLDLGKHRVEAVREQADFILAELLRAQREVAFLGDLPRHIRDREQRTRHHALQPPREEIGDQHRCQRHQPRNAQIAEQPVVQLVLGLQIDGADDLAIGDDALEHDQVVALDAYAVRLRKRRKLLVRAVDELRKELPLGVIDRRGAHLRPVAQQIQILLRHASVIECQRGRGRAPEQLCLRRQVGDPAAVIEPQVVGDHGSDGNEHGDERREQHDHQQFLLNRACRKRDHG
jgi:hypothetical protein